MRTYECIESIQSLSNKDKRKTVEQANEKKKKKHYPRTYVNVTTGVVYEHPWTLKNGVVVAWSLRKTSGLWILLIDQTQS